jgi:hypothetical protein
MEENAAEHHADHAGLNRLRLETSPYLLQHADNPVDWFAWNGEAFSKAVTEDKPLFLSIGYSSCHWCHVMEQESFRDPDVAALLNRFFVSVKVDREERPDIDQAYMAMAQVATGQGGWPLTVLMTPDGRPFFLATYLPRESLPGRVGMLDLLSYVGERWRVPDLRRELLKSSSDIVEYTRRVVAPSGGRDFPNDAWPRAYQELANSFDTLHGGFGDAPKFPTPERLRFLLRYWKDTGEVHALDMVTRTLDEMRQGGIYDQLGSGFHRYSVDSRWAVPHFEKMLYDQALLVETYLDAFLATGEPRYAATAHDVLGYVQRRLRGHEGGFYCAEDADTQEGEGAYYLWTVRQLRESLEPEQLSAVMISAGLPLDSGRRLSAETLSEEQPFVLAFVNPVADVAQALGLSPSRTGEVLDAAMAVLLSVRDRREPVKVDDKVVADWNGLTISAFARAGRALGVPEYVDVARRAADFVLSRMVNSDGVLMHAYKDGVAAVAGFVDDYAAMARGLLELYQSSQEPGYLTSALRLVDRMVELFCDEADGGFFQTGTGAEELVVRVKPVHDGALPSGNALAASVLAVAVRLTERSDLERVLGRLFAFVATPVSQSPGGFVSLLMAHRSYAGESRVTVIAGEPGTSDTDRLLRGAASVYAPDNFVVLAPSGEPDGVVPATLPVAEGHGLFHGRSAAYVCTRHACAEPVTDPQQLRLLLA